MCIALAEALDWPHSDWTTRVTLSDGALEVVHDVDDGEEVLRLPLPAVVTTQQGLNEPRYPTTPNVMKAKRKPLETVELASLEEAGAPPTPELSTRAVVAKSRRRELIEGLPAAAAAELVRRLRKDAKVL